MNSKTKWEISYKIGIGFLIIGGSYAAYKIIFGEASTDQKGAPDFDSIATRELRAKNPLGVSLSSTFDWENIDLSYQGRPNRNKPGEIPVPGVDNLLGDHLVVFQKTQDGLNAAAWLLHDGYFLKGYTTPATIGNRWAGDKTGQYGNSLASIMKVSPDQTLVYGADGPSLMGALARMENGTPAVINIPAQMYRTAIIYGEAV